MALHPDFNQWLTARGIQPPTLSILRKESILQESTLKLLTDDDLESLKKKHGISLGQFALLRSARDDLTSVVEEGFEVIEIDDVPGGRPGSADRPPREDRNVSPEPDMSRACTAVFCDITHTSFVPAGTPVGCV